MKTINLRTRLISKIILICFYTFNSLNAFAHVLVDKDSLPNLSMEKVRQFNSILSQRQKKGSYPTDWVLMTKNRIIFNEGSHVMIYSIENFQQIGVYDLNISDAVINNGLLFVSNFNDGQTSITIIDPSSGQVVKDINVMKELINKTHLDESRSSNHIKIRNNIHSVEMLSTSQGVLIKLENEYSKNRIAETGQEEPIDYQFNYHYGQVDPNSGIKFYYQSQDNVDLTTSVISNKNNSFRLDSPILAQVKSNRDIQIIDKSSKT